MIDRLLTLQRTARPLINAGRAAGSAIMQDGKLKKEISALYMYYFGRAITGCKNCYADALIELCTLKKEIAMKKTELFTLKRGVMLKDTRNRDVRLTLVRGGETEEKVLYHLYTNPECKKYFEVLPDDETLAEKVKAFGEKFEAERNGGTGDVQGIDPVKLVNDARDEASAIVTEAVEKAKAITEAADADAKTTVEAAKDEATEIVKLAKETAAAIVNAANTAKTEAKTAAKKADVKAGADPIME